MTLRRGARLVVPLLAGALLVTSCGGGNDDEEAGGSKPVTEGSAINPQEPSALQKGGELTWGLNEIPPNFNYNQLDGTLADAYDVEEALMPRPFFFDPKGQPSVAKDFFTDVELTSKSPQVITYTINPKATWTDGRALSWEDLAAQAKAVSGADEAFLISSSTGYVDIDKVERGKDDQQAVVTFKKVYSDWQSLFSPLYPKQVNADAKAFNTSLTDGLPVSAGPFKFKGVDKTAKTVTIERNPTWWGTPAVLDRIVYRVVASDAAPDAIANGEIDYYNVGGALDAFKRVNASGVAEVRQALGPDYRHMTFNGAKGSILADRELRLAIMKGIDRTPIAKALIGQTSNDPTPLGNHIFVKGTAGYKDNSGVIAYDPAAAAADLDRLGWVKQGTGRVKDGKKLVIRDVIPAQVTTSAQESQIVQQQLSAIGVELKIQTVPSADFFAKYVNTGDFDVTHFAWLGTPFPVSSSGSIYALNKDVQQNYGRIGTPEINALFDQANQELDPAKKIDLANKIDEQVWAQGHSLLMYQRPQNHAVTKKVANLGSQAFGSRDFALIGLMA